MSALSRLDAIAERREEINNAWERLILLSLDEGNSLRSVAKAARTSHVSVANRDKKRAKVQR